MKRERANCKRCGDSIEVIDYYPYCCEYCEDRGLNPRGDDDLRRCYGSRLKDGFKTLRKISESSQE